MYFIIKHINKRGDKMKTINLIIGCEDKMLIKEQIDFANPWGTLILDYGSFIYSLFPDCEEYANTKIQEIEKLTKENQVRLWIILHEDCYFIINFDKELKEMAHAHNLEWPEIKENQSHDCNLKDLQFKKMATIAKLIELKHTDLFKKIQHHSVYFVKLDNNWINCFSQTQYDIVKQEQLRAKELKKQYSII